MNASVNGIVSSVIVTDGRFISCLSPWRGWRPLEEGGVRISFLVLRACSYKTKAKAWQQGNAHILFKGWMSVFVNRNDTDEHELLLSAQSAKSAWDNLSRGWRRWRRWRRFFSLTELSVKSFWRIVYFLFIALKRMETFGRRWCQDFVFGVKSLLL